MDNGATWEIAAKDSAGAIRIVSTVVGEIKMADGHRASGSLECNGAAVPRTTDAGLFAVIGTTYGAGDGSTTFNLPDLRGEFVRGWDHGNGSDPNAATRTNRGGGNTGDNVGTKHADEFELHGHPFRLDATDGNDLDPSGGFTTSENTDANVPAFTGTPSATLESRSAARAAVNPGRATST